jgi:crotonobetainyl-CoA:carnitine CoA-transferase CaiB-like acyl-CoA transferase
LDPVTVPSDASAAARPLDTHLALMPLSLDGQRLPVRQAPPRIGQHSWAVLQELGYDAADIHDLVGAGIVGAPQPQGEA